MVDIKKVLKKKVIVEPRIPVRLNKDLYIARTTGPIELTVGNIDRCMLLGAKVFEVLEDGTKIMLYRSNYNKDNSNLQKTKIDPNSSSAKQKAEAAVNNAKLTEEDKKSQLQQKVENKQPEQKVENKQENKSNQEVKNNKPQDKKENNK